MTRFDQTGVTLTKHQNNAALGVNILPDAEMRAYGFTDHAPENGTCAARSPKTAPPRST